MPSTYDDFKREPSIPHQCMHTHSSDGRRCRAIAMHNNYMCFAHRDKVIPPVYENEPFEIPTALTRDAIQQALGDLATRLASNRMDLKRAGLLAYILQIASSNLAPEPTCEPTVAISHFDSDLETARSPHATGPEPAPAGDETLDLHASAAGTQSGTPSRQDRVRPRARAGGAPPSGVRGRAPRDGAAPARLGEYARPPA